MFRRDNHYFWGNQHEFNYYHDINFNLQNPRVVWLQ